MTPHCQGLVLSGGTLTKRPRLAWKQLLELATLEEQHQEACEAASTASKSLRGSLESVLLFLDRDPESELKAVLADLPEDPQGNWWFDLVFELGLLGADP